MIIVSYTIINALTAYFHKCFKGFNTKIHDKNASLATVTKLVNPTVHLEKWLTCSGSSNK